MKNPDNPSITEMKPQTMGFLAWVSCILGCIPLVGLLVGIKVCSH